MPGKNSKSKNSEGPTTGTATGASNIKIRVAIISSVSLVIVAAINSNWCGKGGTDPPKSFAVTVKNRVTEEAVKGATVRLESEGVPPKIQTSDTNGFVQFRVDDPKKKVRIWVEADGFEKSNWQVIPSDNGNFDAHLNPVRNIIPAPSPTLEPSPSSKSTSRKGTGPQITGNKSKPMQPEEGNPEKKESASEFIKNLNAARSSFRMKHWESASYFFNKASKYVDKSEINPSKLQTAKDHYDSERYREAAETFNKLFSKF